MRRLLLEGLTKKWARPGQLAEEMGVTTNTIKKMAEDGRLPKPLKLGKTLRFDVAEVREYLARLQQDPTSA